MIEADHDAGLRLRREDHDGVAVLAVSGDLDIHAASALRDGLAPLLDGGHRRLVVDLQEVQFLDSTGLGVLVGAMKRARHGGPAVELVCTRAPTLRVLHYTGLDRVFRIHASLDDALAA